MRKKDISIAFVGQLVPDIPEFQNIALTRAGNMVQDGIVSSLHNLGCQVTVFSLRPIASFPKDSKIFFQSKTIYYNGIIKLKLVPFINVLFIKTLSCMFSNFLLLIIWAIKNRNNKRYIMVYNAADPPLPFIYWIGRLTRSKSYAILYDLGMPPSQLKLSLLKKNIYRLVEFFAKIYIPRLDGRIVINENIANDYAPGKSYLLIDGGISSNIIDRLFELQENKNRTKTVFVLAGSLWGGNGTLLIINALKNNSNPNIEVRFAGWGQDEELIEEASRSDDRIKFLGKLDLNQLFDLYKDADVLLNIRITEGNEGDYLFPSKILEYLTVGKFVITTKVAHIEKEYGHLCRVLQNNSPEELSAVMNELSNMSSTELLSNGFRARNYMLNHHTWDKQALKIIDYLTK